MLARYIGGDFDSSTSLSFENEDSDIFENYFPKKIDQLYRNFYETATDGIAKIILEIFANSNLPVKLWFPKHYCFETIYRVENKLKGLLAFSTISFDSYTELKKSDDQTNILLFNHFNLYNESFPTIIKEYINKGWLTIEDFVHAPLDISKTTANYSVNSLRKLTDIEVSVSYTLTPNETLTQKASDYYNIKKEAAKIKSDFLKTGNPGLEQKYLDLFKKAETGLNRKEIVFAYEKEVERLKKINWTNVLAKRIKNYSYLSDKILHEKNVQLLNGKYMYLITKPNQRDELKKYLFQNGIFPVIHWPDSHDNIKDQILSFHIDQRYEIPDMERTYNLIKQFYTAQ